MIQIERSQARPIVDDHIFGVKYAGLVFENPDSRLLQFVRELISCPLDHGNITGPGDEEADIDASSRGIGERAGHGPLGEEIGRRDIHSMSSVINPAAKVLIEFTANAVVDIEAENLIPLQDDLDFRAKEIPVSGQDRRSFCEHPGDLKGCGQGLESCTFQTNGGVAPSAISREPGVVDASHIETS